MDEHGIMRQWRGGRCHLWEEAILLHDRARARVKQAASRKAEADASAEARLREWEARLHQARQAAEQQQEDWQTARAWRRTPEQLLQGPEPQGPAERRRAGEATDAAEIEPAPGMCAEAGPSDGATWPTGGPIAGRLGRKRGEQPNQSARRKAATKAAAEAARAAG